MLKRIFWLALAALAGWLAWAWLRGRQREFADHTPQLARSPFVAPPPPAAGPYERADDDQVAPAEPIVPPARVAPAEPIVPPAPVAPAAAQPAEPYERADDDQVAPAEPYERADDDQVAPAEPPAAEEDQVAPAEPPAAEGEILGYCVRCRTKRPIQGAQLTTSESGRRAARGTCPVCGANMYTFLAAEE